MYYFRDFSASSPERPKSAVKKVQNSVSGRRTSTPIKSAPKLKETTPVVPLKPRPPKTKGGLKQPLRLTKRGRPPVSTPKKNEVVEEEKEEIFEIVEETEENEKEIEELKEGRPVTNKRKKIDEDDFEDSSKLKSLSVVIERSSDKKIKLTSGEIFIKEEATESENSGVEKTPEKSVKKITSGSSIVKFPKTETPLKPIKKAPANKKVTETIITKGPKMISTGPTKSASPVKIAKPLPNIIKCKKCAILEQKVFKMEALEMSRGLTVKCQRCPVIELELKKVEEELEDIIESKLSKCQRCSLIEQKARRIEANLRKTQTEVNKLNNRLLAIDISEENFMKYKNKVKSYTGFPSYEYLMLVFEHVKPRLSELSHKGVSCFQMFILTIMKLKLNLPFWDLAFRFAITTTYSQNMFSKYVSILDSMLSHVILWPKANMEFRLQVLAGNLKQSFQYPYDKIEVSMLTSTNPSKLTEKDKCIRVCSALYHISQLVSSNHSQQLIRILKTTEEASKKGEKEKSDESSAAGEENKDKQKENTEVALTNGTENVDDTDIFFEDFCKDPNMNSKESLLLEIKHLRKEFDALLQRIHAQFKFYTGLRNYQVFKNLYAYLTPHVTNISTDKLTHFQQLHLILMRLKLNLEVEDLGYLFNVDSDHIVKITQLWIDVLGQKLAAYIDWPGGVQDLNSQKRLLGTVKLKYQILWGPALAPRNKDTGRERESIDEDKLLKACAAVYNIDDIEVLKNGKNVNQEETYDDIETQTNEELENSCIKIREDIYELRKHLMSSIATCLTEEKLQKNDEMVNYLTGFASLDTLKFVLNQIVPASKPDKKSVSVFQQFILALIRLKLNLTTQDLGHRFGVGNSNTIKIIQDWISILHSQVSTYITWPDDDDDALAFTELLMNTYAYIKCRGSAPFSVEAKQRTDFEIFDTPTLVCAGLYNIGIAAVSALKDPSDLEALAEDWED